MTKAPVVKVAELNPDCEGCRAAEKRLHTYAGLVATAKRKIREQAEKIEELKRRRFTYRELEIIYVVLSDMDNSCWSEEDAEAIEAIKGKC